MTSAEIAVEERPWSRTRWVLWIIFILVVQMVFIFSLGSFSRINPAKAVPSPKIQFAMAGPDELLRLSDPTLFALPHRETFSGRAWLQISPHIAQPFEWTEAWRWLDLPERELGEVFQNFMGSNVFAMTHVATLPAPELTTVTIPPDHTAPARSTVQAEGARRLVAPMELPFVDALGKSVVQARVDANGNVLSVVLLPPGCGVVAADQRALELALAARFEPQPRNNFSMKTNSSTMVVKMVFDWVPAAPATNAPMPNP